MFVINVGDLDSSMATLQKLPSVIERQIIRGALRAAGMVFVKEARARVPRRTGRLANTSRVTTRTELGRPVAYVKVGDRFRVMRNGRTVKGAPYRTARPGGGVDYHTAYYAHMVEHGTRPHVIRVARGRAMFVRGVYRRVIRHPGARPRPFMGPAFIAGIPGATVAFKEYILKRIPVEAEKLLQGKP